jgi:hypothetical protein
MQTGILNRAKPSSEIDYEEWLFKRNTQCNFDTILQAISLRSLPEVTVYPTKKNIKFSETKFGTAFSDYKKIVVWYFEFSIQSISVYTDDENELGALIKDIQGVPMIKFSDDYKDLVPFLNVSKELCNTYFVKY